MADPCPHCGSDDYGPVNEGMEQCCLTCGYDTEHGTAGVCPGGLHPRDGSRICCPACWKRVPRDLPGQPRWRSALRTLNARGHHWTALAIEEALVKWLAEHPAESGRGR